MMATLIAITLAASVISLAIPVYSVVMLARCLTIRSAYSPWPPSLMLLIWLVQWPLLLVLAFKLPGAGSISGDGHESPLFDLLMLAIFLIYNAGPLYWVYRHRAQFVIDT